MATSISSCDITLKILIVGDPSIGKSSLIWRMSENIFPTLEQANINMANSVKSKAIQFGRKQILLKFLDTAGQERFRTISRSFYSTTDIIILSYDQSNQSSFDHLTQWYTEVQRYAKKDCYIALASTKKESTQQVVNPSTAQNFANEKGISFIETSAASGEGVDELVQLVVKGAGEKLYSEENWTKLRVKANENPNSKGTRGGTQSEPRKTGFCQIL
ncbi:hypothetical protein DICPUDRAFT_89854 [Dictyostelium purpureum]|uniref:Rab GTPase n=1 Tax=Dictyostelium purpureum TaxID=5786 RepID=F0ZYK4_DICPU|nr:uncharacterized protein DICPUDRAFT_89854 [Dictyostelium purpureum]EGC30970.1 hypothetical protein DICPUDRAFT_89854 [Dictyostelium purpureum]|eukprot:XP_003292497.1 hypothetical protein DICPUDRAFT_89854 [Dictyostelium purpureum]